MKSIGVWEPWPSRMSSRWPVADGEVCGIDMRLNHSIPIAFDVQPFSEVVYSQSDVLTEGNHVDWRFFPVKLTRHCSFLPTALTHSSTLTHSRDSGDFFISFLLPCICDDLLVGTYTKCDASLIKIPHVLIGYTQHHSGTLKQLKPLAYSVVIGSSSTRALNLPPYNRGDA